MNGPALIGVMAAAAVLALIYVGSDRDSVWPRIGLMLVCFMGIMELNTPWLEILLIIPVVGIGIFGWRGIDRFPWEAFAHWLKHGPDDDWQDRHSGDDPGDFWRDARPDEGETGYRDDGQEGERAGGDPPRATSTERSQALQTLGLDGGATDSDIRRAHRRLMKKHHPDRGGSTETAMRLNRARELLLGT